MLRLPWKQGEGLVGLTDDTVDSQQGELRRNRGQINNGVSKEDSKSGIHAPKAGGHD